MANEDDLPSGDFDSLGGATAWLNSHRLTRTDLRGRVVLINFWTYSCINWRRTLPYVRAWAKKYKDQGLVVIGVHTPEFAFEKDVDIVRQAATAMKIDYPVAMDNNCAVWRAFNTEYWPALYFADAQEHIRAHKFGEGDYDQSERALQQLLTRAGAALQKVKMMNRIESLHDAYSLLLRIRTSILHSYLALPSRENTGYLVPGTVAGIFPLRSSVRLTESSKPHRKRYVKFGSTRRLSYRTKLARASLVNAEVHSWSQPLFRLALLSESRTSRAT